MRSTKPQNDLLFTLETFYMKTVTVLQKEKLLFLVKTGKFVLLINIIQNKRKTKQLLFEEDPNV